MAEDVILTSIEGRIATLTLNRPGRLNALSPDLLSQSIETLTRWEADPEVAVVVVTGAGRAFCAGGDIGGMAQEKTAPRNPQERIALPRRGQNLSILPHEMPQSTNSQVHSLALGAGVSHLL